MKYNLVYTKRAVKDIGNLDTLAKKKLGKKLLWLAEDPISRSKKLINPSVGMYRYRIGDHRVVFDIAESEIIILCVGHRKEIYR